MSWKVIAVVIIYIVFIGFLLTFDTSIFLQFFYFSVALLQINQFYAKMLQSWIENTRSLLDQEHQEEINQRNHTLSNTTTISTHRKNRPPPTLLPLDLKILSLGYFGKTIATLERYGGKAVAKPGQDRAYLPTHGITTGDVVLLRPVGSQIILDSDGNLPTNVEFPTGVVKRVRDYEIDIIFDQDDAAEHSNVLQTHT